MLSEREYLWLCELAHTNLLRTQRSASILELLTILQPEMAAKGCLDLAQNMRSSQRLMKYKLLELVEGPSYPELYLFHHEDANVMVIVLQDLPAARLHTVYDMNRAAQDLKLRLIDGARCICTGMGYSGWRAAQLADALDIEAVVFGAPSVEELPGKAVNYVCADDPVGDATAKVAFVKQRVEDDEAEGPLSNRLAFSDDGRPILSEQSEFSRFVSWFYSSAGAVEPEIWRYFFSEAEEEGGVLPDLGVYSVYLHIGELSEGTISQSIEHTIRHARQLLEANRCELELELAKITDEDYQKAVPACAEAYAQQAAERVGLIFDSVQTILMGAALFTLDREMLQVEPWMAGFGSRISELMVQEQEKLQEILDLAISRHLERQLSAPELSLEW
ncbi:hypothetical protein DCC85_16320 [Paenibacillus sp. CAA11]|uniref:hypothetical protein n=1 Tax=Paenibacillus sp. CAA11 TaxID=1532905 RepID=UPI000D34A65B|nr:hypothetical protein [Paenibacillus sp. CAA11]AWB45604.1 hypothetical protein DCC85_16320 [Paenibacillus sp. CAA11]